jgi:DNA helicase-2/ATP-dependent DNA helicase PcrA
MLYEINTIYAAFNSAMKDKNVFNYGKLLIDTFSMLNSDSNLKQRCRQKYEFIIVDELQELNSAQYSLLEEISDDNIIYFGDDDQSVYKFRGSNINIFF